MADSAVAITAGAGTNIDTYAIAGGDHQQIVRQAKATATTTNAYTPGTVPVVAQVPADASRVLALMCNASTARVYLGFGTLVPTAAAYQWYVDPGDRYEVPLEFVTQAVNVLGASVGTGALITTLATAA